MRLRGRQGRFVLASITGWAAARIGMTWTGLGAILGIGAVTGLALFGS